MKNGKIGKYRNALQRQALRDAYKLLADHFDDVLVVCSMRADHEALGTDPDVFWKGGYIMALGLADVAKHRIQYQRRPTAKPE
jgi:hypothetical protein